MCLSFILLNSCSISKNKNKDKKKDENGVETNMMQNFTTKYNILYNAKNMLRQEELNIERYAKANYQIHQPIFVEPTAEGDAHQLMDSLVQKAYKIINLKEQSKYISEAYYTIGQAFYLKGGYYTAVEYFDYLAKNTEHYKEFIPLAYAWKAKALMQTGRLARVQSALDSAYMFANEDKKTLSLIHASQAKFLLLSDQPKAAIPFLERAIPDAARRSDKLRWQFLLAQLYQQEGNYAEAYQLFQKIGKSNVPFEMSFEADLQAAFLKGDASQPLEARLKPLKKMLKEGKNKDFKDQIYFQIGKLYYADGKIEDALKNYRISLAQEGINNYQATETYLALADHYFQEGKYATSKLYYDSVGAVLPQDYTNVAALQRKIVYLNDLIVLYEELVWQDTLLQLAALSDRDREEQISSFVALSLSEKQKEIEQLKKQGTKKDKKPVQNFSRRTNIDFDMNTNAYSDNRFYFNNQDAMLMGTTEFKRRWGSRQLVDNWRYSGTASGLRPQVSTAGNPAMAATTAAAAEFDAESFIQNETARYVTAIPQNQADFDRANQIIHNNLIQIGNIYRDYMRDPEAAIIAFERFIKNYPNSPQGAEIYYSLYRLYADKDHQLSASYRQRLLNQYPTSIYAQVIKDPDYLAKLAREQEVLNLAYEKIFTLYAEGMHQDVITEVDHQIKTTEGKHSLLVQLEYLRALAIGRTARVEDFVQALEGIVTKFPEDSLVVPLAQENIAFVAEHPNLFINRVNALQDIKSGRIAFVDEPHMTAWPELLIHGDYRSGQIIAKKEEAKKEEPTPVIAQVEKKKEEQKLEVAQVEKKEEEQKIEEILEKRAETAELHAKKVDQILPGSALSVDVQMIKKSLGKQDISIDFGPNDYRDKELFPDTAVYYFVINVDEPRVNLSPSRYGIGQFNRARYNNRGINHQVKDVNGENQLLYIGPFQSYDDVKLYESRILPLMKDIMKIPENIYNTFVITETYFGTLSDNIQIRNYVQTYQEQ